MTLRTRYVSWLGLACSLAASCTSEYSVDEGRFCEQFIEDANCRPTPGGGGASGSGGTGGSAAGTGGSGAGAGSGGAGGSAGSGCEAPKVVCGEACVDTQSDAKHCGECGYACEGESACVGGACAPLAVVSGVVAPYAFALDADNLYFVSPARTLDDQEPPAVQKVGRGGGALQPVFDADETYRSRSLALSGGMLYFGDLEGNGQIRRGLTAGGETVQHVSNPQTAVQQLVVANDDLWWVRVAGGNSSLCVGLLSGGSSSACIDDSTGGYNGVIKAFALEGDVAYWVSTSSNPAGLWSRPDDFAKSLVSDANMVALALRPDTDTIFVATALGLASASKTTPQGSLTPLPTPVNVGGVVQGFTVSGEHLYWLAFEIESGGEAGAAGAGGAGESSLALHRSSFDGSGARVLGRVPVKSPTYWAQPIGPSQLTVDGGFVYFADPGVVSGVNLSDPTLNAVKGEANGAIYRLPQ